MIAVDTNVFIYAYDTSSPDKRDRARALLIRLDGAILLWQVACEFIAASRKILSPEYDPVVIWQRLDEIRAVFPLIPPTKAALELARSLHTSRGVSFWDAMLVGACLSAGVSTLYTEDLPGSRIEGLEILNPFG